MIAAKFTKNFTEYDYFDKNLKQVQADLKATFPHSEVEITSYSVNKNKFIAKISSKDFPLEYFFYDQDKGHLVKVADGYPEAKSASLGIVSQYDYTAGDGLAIEGYFTKPTINKDELPPLIVIPHGGPEGRDNMNFDWIRQFFASEGYAVFQSNFRGSSGYGKKFATAGYGEWGKKMQQDIDDGVDSLIQNKLVDPNRICVVGASYGGYVALYSATKRHDKYKCSVSFAGVGNLSDMFYHAKEQSSGFSYWEKSIGERRDLKSLNAYSPLKLITKNTRPILMFHGEKDTVVPIFQSEKMYKTL
jgi:dipeptidyl aminopeptidase/acylaminoacyl peptidase